MKVREWIKKWNLSSLKFNAKFLEMEFTPSEPDQEAAWELYVELVTRITTQFLEPDDGDEQAALNSIFSLFETTRNNLKRHGRKCVQLTRIAVVVLNQIVRPFTVKWHKISIANGFAERETRDEFRKELAELQVELRAYTELLAAIADVEDLTTIEE